MPENLTIRDISKVIEFVEEEPLIIQREPLMSWKVSNGDHGVLMRISGDTGTIMVQGHMIHSALSSWRVKEFPKRLYA